MRDGDANLGSKCAKSIVALFRHQSLVRYVKRHNDDWCSRFKNNISSLRVDINVEFSGWRDVAHFKIGAAHQNDFGNTLHDIRCFAEGRRDIGERSQRAECHGARRLATQGFNDKIHRMLLLQRHHRIRQIGAVQPGFPVHMLRGDEVTAKRPVATGKDLCFRFSRQFADDACVLCRQRQGHIACHACYAQNFQRVRARKRQQNGDGVVLSGVCVDDDFSLCHGASLETECGKVQQSKQCHNPVL